MQCSQTSLILVAEVYLGEFKNHTRKSKSFITIKVCTYLVPVYFGFTAQKVVTLQDTLVAKSLLIATLFNATLSAIFISSGKYFTVYSKSHRQLFF